MLAADRFDAPADAPADAPTDAATGGASACGRAPGTGTHPRHDAPVILLSVVLPAHGLRVHHQVELADLPVSG